MTHPLISFIIQSLPSIYLASTSVHSTFPGPSRPPYHQSQTVSKSPKGHDPMFFRELPLGTIWVPCRHCTPAPSVEHTNTKCHPPSILETCIVEQVWTNHSQLLWNRSRSRPLPQHKPYVSQGHLGQWNRTHFYKILKKGFSRRG